MLRTVSTSGRHVGLLVHVPVAASVVRDHRLLTVASAVHGGGQTPYGPATPGDPVDSHPLGPRQISAPPPRMNDHYHLSTLRVRYQARP